MNTGWTEPVMDNPENEVTWEFEKYKIRENIKDGIFALQKVVKIDIGLQKMFAQSLLGKIRKTFWNL